MGHAAFAVEISTLRTVFHARSFDISLGGSIKLMQRKLWLDSIIRKFEKQKFNKNITTLALYVHYHVHITFWKITTTAINAQVSFKRRQLKLNCFHGTISTALYNILRSKNFAIIANEIQIIKSQF